MKTEFIKPMLLEHTNNNEPIDGDEYINELKLDGVRLLAYIGDEKRFFTRHGLDVTSRFPELQKIPIPDGTILDGELIVTDRDGKPDFEELMKRFHSKRSHKMVQFVAFDVIMKEHRRITSNTLMERKFMLDHLISEDSYLLAKMKYIVGNGDILFDVVKKEGLEGIVQKLKHSKYEIGKRSNKWLKVINYQFADVFVSGYKKKELGWFLTFDNGEYAGVMELGIPPKVRIAFYQVADSLKQYEDDDVVYLERVIRCRVKYRNLTSNGLLRLPSFVDFVY